MTRDDGLEKLTQAQRELALEMSEISEEYWCAGWLIDCEHELWRMVLGGGRRWGMGDVSEDEIARLKRLSDACGGWIVWVSGSGETFVPMAEWLPLHAAWDERQRAWAEARS